MSSIGPLSGAAPTTAFDPKRTFTDHEATGFGGGWGLDIGACFTDRAFANPRAFLGG